MSENRKRKLKTVDNRYFQQLQRTASQEAKKERKEKDRFLQQGLELLENPPVLFEDSNQDPS